MPKSKKINAYRRYVNAVVTRIKNGNSDTINLEIQNSVSDCLRDYAEGKMPRFPREVAFELANAMRDVLHGFTPELFRPRARRRGQSANTPTVDSCIEDAVRYVNFCRAGFIPDRSPNKTVREAFSVRETTVREWCRNQKYKRAVAPTGKPSRQKVQRVSALMRFSARSYPMLPGAASMHAIRHRATTK